MLTLNPLAIFVIAYLFVLAIGIPLLARYFRHRDDVAAIRARLRNIIITARRDRFDRRR